MHSRQLIWCMQRRLLRSGNDPGVSLLLQRHALDGLHQAIPAGDPWAELVWSLAEQLVAPEPAGRPELAGVLAHELFTSSQVSSRLAMQAVSH